MIDNIYTCQNIMPISELFRTAPLYCASAGQRPYACYKWRHVLETPGF